MSRRTWLALALVLAACAEERPRAAPEPPEPPEAPSAPTPAPASPRAEPADEPASSAEPPASPPAPAAGCAFGEPTRLAEGEGWAAIAAAEGAFFVAGSAPQGEGESAFVARIEPDGTSRILARAALDDAVPRGHRRAAPAVAVRAGRVAFVLVDGARQVRLGDVAASGGALTWHALGGGGSLRFSPAIAAAGERLAVAWTTEDAAAPSVHAALFETGEVTEERALRPAGGGAAAPRFVEGAAAPSLVFLDPRAGVSVVHRAGVDGRGFADPRVARPLSMLAEPPEIAAVRAGGAEWIAYTAVGSAAMSAVGLARLDVDAPPVALVPGTGYGLLHVGAASLGDGRAVFVADAPQAPAPDAPRELHVRTLSRDGALSAPVIVRGPSGSASRGRIAHAGGGVVAVAFTDPAGVHVALGRCAP